MKRSLLIAFVWIAVDAAAAQPLVDPMRPPSSMISSPNARRASSASPDAEPRRPIVQTIIIGPDRRYAVVDGRTVREGDRVRNMRVGRIEESRVILLDATGARVPLDLLTGIRKKSSASTAQSERSAIAARASKE